MNSIATFSIKQHGIHGKKRRHLRATAATRASSTCVLPPWAQSWGVLHKPTETAWEWRPLEGEL